MQGSKGKMLRYHLLLVVLPKNRLDQIPLYWDTSLWPTMNSLFKGHKIALTRAYTRRHDKAMKGTL